MGSFKPHPGQQAELLGIVGNSTSSLAGSFTSCPGRQQSSAGIAGFTGELCCGQFHVLPRTASRTWSGTVGFPDMFWCEQFRVVPRTASRASLVLSVSPANNSTSCLTAAELRWCRRFPWRGLLRVVPCLTLPPRTTSGSRLV